MLSSAVARQQHRGLLDSLINDLVAADAQGRAMTNDTTIGGLREWNRPYDAVTRKPVALSRLLLYCSERFVPLPVCFCIYEHEQDITDCYCRWIRAGDATGRSGDYYAACPRKRCAFRTWLHRGISAHDSLVHRPQHRRSSLRVIGLSSPSPSRPRQIIEREPLTPTRRLRLRPDQRRRDEELTVHGLRLLTSTGVEGSDLANFLDRMNMCDTCGLWFTPNALGDHALVCEQPNKEEEVCLITHSSTSGLGKGKGKVL